MKHVVFIARVGVHKRLCTQAQVTSVAPVTLEYEPRDPERI